MTKNEYCPVPKDQIPSVEFQTLCNDWFFNKVVKQRSDFLKLIVVLWFSSLPFFYVIAQGSYVLQKDIIHCLFFIMIGSLLLPILLSLRQLLSWRYIYNRLIDKVIKYEETDWHDGQKWLKNEDMKSKDLLIGLYEVQPIIKYLEKFLLTTLIILLLAGLSYRLIP